MASSPAIPKLAGPGYSYAHAKAALNETDKDRFLCCYLNIVDTSAVNWEKAAADFGSASVASFKKMISNAFKKVKDAEAAGDVPTPGSKAKITPKKRKGRASPDEEDAAATPGVEDGAEITPTPKKKKGRKAKSADAIIDYEDNIQQEPKPADAEGEDEDVMT